MYYAQVGSGFCSFNYPSFRQQEEESNQKQLSQANVEGTPLQKAAHLTILSKMLLSRSKKHRFEIIPNRICKLDDLMG